MTDVVVAIFSIVVLVLIGLMVLGSYIERKRQSK